MNFKKLSLIVLSVISITPLHAEKGYFWYDEADKKKEPLDISKFQKAAPKQYSQEEMMKMHPDFIAQILDESHKYAIQTLEPEDYQYYLFVLDVARKKAAAATSLQSTVLLDTAELNPNTQYPVTNASSTTRKRENERLILDRLRKESSNYALGFFVSQTCSYCKDQVPALQLFQDKTGWNISEIDINERPDLVERFGVKMTPTLVLIKRNSKTWRPVAVGVESLPKIEQNTYKTIRLIEGEVAPSEFNTLENQDNGFFDSGARL